MNIRFLNVESPASTVRVQSIADTDWVHMHHNCGTGTSRPCFTVQLLSDLKINQMAIASRALVSDGPGPSRFMVVASDADVFNLGGDLQLFTQLIRSGKRDDLYKYAQLCIEVAYGFSNLADGRVHSIALVQGDALGGGFEAALSCHTIVAESGVGMGFPEVLFDLFPGMGAYSFLCKRISPRLAERIMLDGNVYSSDELHRMGLVDVLVPRGQGPAAVEEAIRSNRRIPHALGAMYKVREIAQPVDLGELMRITNIWVDTAMHLGEKSLRIMERLVRAQLRRNGYEADARSEAV